MSRVEIDNVLAQIRHIRNDIKGNALPVDAPAQPNFATLLKQSIDQVNQAQTTAAAQTRAFEMGDRDTSLADVMVSMQKASVSFQAMVQVRNKMVDAYRDVMNMPM